MTTIQNAIIDLLPNQHEFVIGFADMEQLLKDNYPYRYAVVIGEKLDDKVIDGIINGPTIEYFTHYNKVNNDLNGVVLKISDFLKSKGIESLHVFPTIEDSEIDNKLRKTLRYKYSHKMAATRSGIGWIGKTNLLVSEKFGPRFRMASVLTNYQFENPGIPITESRCGNCSICVESCPAQAANGKIWNTEIDRDEFYNAVKCRDMCRKLSFKNIRRAVSLCGRCVAVCPKGRIKNV
ncbi:MAG: epoxyqueuosine reductase [Spirochaetes bacterium]|jgi:epoxyqueuosine reductase QueG|nr:epoxyqueuosine reductase [Spirochaetota bacterium]